MDELQAPAGAHKVRRPPAEEATDLSKVKERIQAAFEGAQAQPDVDERGEIVFREKPKEIERIKTGIPGFDELIVGGIPRDSVILLIGGPGSGKTIFAMQFLVSGAQKYSEPGAFVSFEEREESVRSSAELFGWDVRELEKKDLLRIVWRDPYEVKTFAQAMGGQLYYIIKEAKIKRIVFDSITYFSLSEENRFKLRKEIAELSRRLKAFEVTSIFIAEVPEGEAEIGRYGMEEFVADGVIHMHNFLVRDARQRAIEVIKLRKTSHDTFLHPFKIASRGIEVYPQEQVFKE